MRSTIPLSIVALLAISVFLAGAEKKPWKDLSVQVGDIKVHYVEAGGGDRTVVFVPGWMMTAEIWREQIPYFASRGFRVLAADPRSHGQTTRTEEGNTYQQQAADLNAFIRTLKIRRPILVGWSAGVIVLLEYVSSSEAEQPERLVLVDGGVLGLKEADYPGGMTMQQARSVVLSFQEDRAKATDQFVQGMFKSRQPQLLITEITQASMKVPTGTVVSLLMDIFTGDRRPLLPRVKAPTLIVMAENNRLLGEYLQSKIGGSKLEAIPEAGHAVFLEKPQAFNQVLESFLGEH
jgi:pimeloyl-ACP methyl ester carboxylesterase